MDITDYISEYSEFANTVFNYLKRTLLVDFPSMKLEINYDPEVTNNWGGNIFNKIKLYMSAFINDDYFYNEVHTKNQIIYCLFHESFHQLQFTDDNKYVRDRKYKMFVERNVDYSTMHYLNDHNLELQKELNMIVYTYNIDTLSNHYDNGGILINKNYIDMKYLNKIINKFVIMSNMEVYDLFMKYGTIIIHFVLDNEKSVYKYTIRDNFVLDYEKMNDIITRFMYDGYNQRIYRASKMSVKDGEIIFSIYMNNDNINLISRVK